MLSLAVPVAIFQPQRSAFLPSHRVAVTVPAAARIDQKLPFAASCCKAELCSQV